MMILHRAPQTAESQDPPTGDGVQGQSALLVDDEFALKKDIALVRRAVRERWGVPAAKKRRIAERMCDIAENVPDAETATSAARVLVSMDAADTHAFEILDKIERLDSGKPTEVAGVVYVKGVDEGAV